MNGYQVQRVLPAGGVVTVGVAPGRLSAFDAAREISKGCRHAIAIVNPCGQKIATFVGGYEL